MNSEDVWMGNAQGNHFSSLFANLAVNMDTPVSHPKESALPGPVWSPGICIGESVLSDSDGQAVWGRTYLASVHFADENTEA